MLNGILLATDALRPASCRALLTVGASCWLAALTTVEAAPKFFPRTQTRTEIVDAPRTITTWSFDDDGRTITVTAVPGWTATPSESLFTLKRNDLPQAKIEFSAQTTEAKMPESVEAASAIRQRVFANFASIAVTPTVENEDTTYLGVEESFQDYFLWLTYQHQGVPFFYQVYVRQEGKTRLMITAIGRQEHQQKILHAYRALIHSLAWTGPQPRAADSPVITR